MNLLIGNVNTIVTNQEIRNEGEKILCNG